MTGKRFEVMDYFDSQNKSIKAIRDNETTEIYSMDNELETNSVCIKFNELSDENEQLRKDLKIVEEHRKQETEYTARLEEENEQLRKRLMVCQDKEKGLMK